MVGNWVGLWETLPHQNSTYLLFCTRKYCNTATTSLLCARSRKNKNITKKIRRNNLIMVSTRNSPQKKTCPTGVPTLSGQVRVRAECAEQQAEQQSAAATQANAPIEAAHRPIEEEEVSQLDIVDDDNVYHGNDDDSEGCKACKMMNDVDNDEEEQIVDDEEDVLGTVPLARKSKLALKDTELYTYFLTDWRG